MMNKPVSLKLYGFICLCILVLCAACGGTEAKTTNVNKTEWPYNIHDRKISANTKRLMNYLEDMYGDYIISGIMDTAWTTNSSNDMIARVYEDTEKYPALKGFDFIDLPNSWGGYGKNQVDEAIEWWDGKNKMNGTAPAKQLLPDKPDIHGIIAFCWHWRTGDKKDFYTNNTTFRIPWKDNKLDTASAAFQTIKDDLDKVAALLKLLKDKDIPVLWRPLHEASGGWFWWGASGPAPCIALWEFMYDYFTSVKGLDNLIWVWNGQNSAWFPDPSTVDIVSHDYYTNKASQTSAQNYNSPTTQFNNTKNMVPNADRMVAMSENGAIPDPVKCKNEDALWSWFMVWNDLNAQTDPNKDNFWKGGYHNTLAHKKYVFEHNLVVTLDELPCLTDYRLD